MLEFLNEILKFLQSLPTPIAQGMIWGIMAIGVFITFKILDLADLTVDGTFSIGGIVLVLLALNGMNIYLALLIAFIAGCIAGLITGILHTKFGIPAILAGILTQLALYSLYLRISNGESNVFISSDDCELIADSDPDTLGYTILILTIFIVVIIALLYWFFGTELGHSIRATGSNQAMAKANGINTDTRKIIGLVISNGIVALAGGLDAQFNSADVNAGKGAIVIGLAAVIIGEVLFSKIFKNFALRLASVVIGGIIYFIINRIVLKMGLKANDLQLFSAIVVALFLGIPYWKSKMIPKKIKQDDGGAENA